MLASAIPVAEEIQVAEVVKFWVVPSEKVPVAVNCALMPLAREELAGVMTIEVSTAGVIVTPVDPEIPPKVAIIVALPIPTPFASPWLPSALLTVAKDGFDEAQFAKAVRS